MNDLSSPLARAALVAAAVIATGACAKGLTPLAGGSDTGGAGGADATTTATGTGTTHDAGTTTGSTSSGTGGSGAGGATTTSTGGAGGTTTTTTTTTTSQGGAGPGPCNLGHVVLSEIRTRGAAGASDEFIELYNATGSAVTLDAAWTIEGRSTDSGTYTKRWAGKGDSIPAHGHYLIVGSSYAQSPAKDDGLASGIKDASGVTLSHNAQIVDALCFGFDAKTLAKFDGTYDCEGTPASNVPHTDGAGAPSDSDASLERKPGGAAGNCTDTGDNASDFVNQAPATPMNSQSPPNP